ncbi:MAG: RagB/SusD family nutrient uptake outer membrane protein [Dysgonomonas sp.]
MKKILIAILGGFLVLSSCDDSFLDTTSTNYITDDAVWTNAVTTQLFVSEVYNRTLSGPLYNMSEGCNNWYSFDHAFTDDMGIALTSLNEFSFTASNIPQYVRGRWDSCYANIRRTNLALGKIPESTVLSDAEKERYEGDMYFMRALNYLELWRFWGGVPLITKALNRFTDDVFYERSTSEETFQLIINDLDSAEMRLPKRSAMSASEYGRATKGAAAGFKVVAYLHAAGVLDKKYYENAAQEAEKFILPTGDLYNEYTLFTAGGSDPATNFANLFLEDYEGNAEVIFDVQYKNPVRTQRGYQTIAAPGYPGVGSDYGWGFSNPSQMIVDAFEMKDGTTFDWNNATEAADPYKNRDARFYASVLYNGLVWKDSTLSLSSNRYIKDASGRWKKVTDNLPNGLYSSKSECTKTGYFIRKHQKESVICGAKNRYTNMDGEGGNLIVLRYAEILLSYAEAKNEVSGPDATVYEAVNAVRKRAGQPDLPSGLDYLEMQKRIRNERRVELAFENKRYFDIIRWKAGEEYLNQPFYGMNITYELVDNVPVARYNKFVYFQKKFDPNKNYLFPIPQQAINQNYKLAGHQNPGW